MKPDVIFKLERGEAPWIEDGEVPSSDSPGECIRIRQMGDGTSTTSAGYWGGIFEMCCRVLLSNSLNLWHQLSSKSYFYMWLLAFG